MDRDSSKIGFSSWIALIALLFLDGFVWRQIFFFSPAAEARFYFMDVGQGDSELVIFPRGVSILTDAGPDASVARALEKILPSASRYIDLAIISHPQLDHMNGFNELLKKYEFGAFITNGRNDDGTVLGWENLIKTIRARKIPLIILGVGDSIINGNNRVELLSPDAQAVQSAELNDTGFVELITAPPLRALLTADTGFNIEQYLLDNFDLRADILKVGHHGSKYSSSPEFLRAVDPKVAIIEVGAKNTYGHPSPETLARLNSSTSAKIFRTDRNGTIAITADNGKLKVFTGK